MSSLREKTDRERGVILVVVLVLAVLYIAMLQLLLMESSEKLRSAQRVRGRIVADILAEDAVELASEGVATRGGRTVNQILDQGSVEGTCQWLSGDAFRLEGRGRAAGVAGSSASIVLEGRIIGSRPVIEHAEYSRTWN